MIGYQVRRLSNALPREGQLLALRRESRFSEIGITGNDIPCVALKRNLGPIRARQNYRSNALFSAHASVKIIGDWVGGDTLFKKQRH